MLSKARHERPRHLPSIQDVLNSKMVCVCNPSMHRGYAWKKEEQKAEV